MKEQEEKKEKELKKSGAILNERDRSTISSITPYATYRRS